MRTRKLKWAKEYIEQSKVVVHKPQNMQGKWRELLGVKELHIEIGSGKGDYWLGMASQYPDVGWIGIEKNESVAALALRKADDAQKHRRFIYGDAAVIETWFAPKELDVIHLNFSDPWPKNRTSKRRLSNERFIKQYTNILKDDGEIQMKTDNRLLFEYSILTFQENNFKLKAIFLNYRSEQHDEDTISEYESKFMKAGKPIYRAVWEKTDEEKR